MFCQKCGREIPDGSVFCANCGTKAGESEAPRVTYVVKEEKAKPILTNAEEVILKIIGGLIITKGGWSLIDYCLLKGGVYSQYAGVMIFGVLLALFWIFIGVMIIALKYRWALTAASVTFDLSAILAVLNIMKGNYFYFADLLLVIIGLILIHKCQKALSKKIQEQRRAQRG